jgi:hypothetical protein
MRPHERGASRAVTRPAPVEHPQATVTKSRGASHSTLKTSVRPVSASSFRRRAPRIDVWDVIGWALFTVAIAGIILTFCLLTTLAWPS